MSDNEAGSDKYNMADAQAEEEARTFYHALDEDNERPPSLKQSHIPYAYPPISNSELNFEWDENQVIPETAKAKRSKKVGKHACVGFSSIASNVEIEWWCLKYYDMRRIWVLPHPNIMPHVFNHNPRLRIPCMVLTSKLAKLGISPPYINTSNLLLNISISPRLKFLQMAGSLPLLYTCSIRTTIILSP